jgi:hypothetical protein
MSDIRISHADMRNILSYLGRIRPNHHDQFEAVDVVAHSLGIPVDNIFDRLRLRSVSDLPGVPLSKEAFEKLVEAVSVKDLTSMKNTERLAIVAACVGWKPDVMMHLLKSTTGDLGRLAYQSSLNATYFEACISEPHRSRWKSVLKAEPGLYVIAGKPSTGLSFAVNSSVAIIQRQTPDAIVRALPEFVSFDGEQIVEAEVTDVASKYPLPTVFEGRITSSEHAGMAFGMAKYFPVVVKYYAEDVGHALHILNFYAAHNPGRLKALLFQAKHYDGPLASHYVETTLHTEETEYWSNSKLLEVLP